jgi:hypothetical protein
MHQQKTNPQNSLNTSHHRKSAKTVPGVTSTAGTGQETGTATAKLTVGVMAHTLSVDVIRIASMKVMITAISITRSTICITSTATASGGRSILHATALNTRARASLIGKKRNGIFLSRLLEDFISNSLRAISPL